MTTERTLKRWRKDALLNLKKIHSFENDTKLHGNALSIEILLEKERSERILRLTQELLDQHLLRER